ncbi:phage adaptor protein [Pararhodobacter sp.]|uniref:phage adaptor protein n=1 Tax=Pararhodobacter sp. TaxID=2127056 RepID=UPI002FDDA739
MAFTAADVMRKASTILQDAGSVRWPLPELLGWLNDGMREIAILKPTATAATATMDLASGTKQALPDTYHQLLTVVRNVPGRVITPIVREVLDTQFPGWHDSDVMPFNASVVHVVNDTFDPRVFYVVPGNTGTGVIEIIASVLPAPIATPVNPLVIESYSGAVPIGDVYQGALTDFILYRAFSKDMNLPNAGQRAQTHYQQFGNALGVKMQNEMTMNVDTQKSRFSQ